MQNEDDNKTIVTSYNQSGGITAHTVNLAPPPRRLDRDTAARLVEQLRAAGSYEVTVYAGPVGGAEAIEYAAAWKQLLLQAGWKASFLNWMDAPPTRGLFVFIRDGEENSAPRGADALIATLQQNGVPVVAGRTPGVEPGKFMLLIGPQPQ